MAFEHPAKFYIRYLLLVLPEPTREVVNEQLGLLGLAEVKTSQFKEIRDGMADTPPGFRLHDRKHRPSAGWLRSMRIYSMVHQDEVVREVLKKYLVDRRLRETVEHLLLGSVSPMEIAFRIRELGYRTKDLTVAEFAHYFWNTEVMGVADWADYFSRDRTRGRTGHLQDLYIPALHGGPELAMYRAGIKVDVDHKKMLEEVRDELVFTFREVRELPLSSKKVEMLGTLSRQIIKVDERISASDAALQDVLKRFEKFKLIDDNEPVPTLIDLAPSGTVSDTSRAEILRSKEGN